MKLDKILKGEYGYTMGHETKLALIEEAYLDAGAYEGDVFDAYVAHAINANDKTDKTVYLCIWPSEPEEGSVEDYNEPSDYINWRLCEKVDKTDEEYDEMVEA